jgi:branched-chain amino acid transport system substrate-binding protein
MGSTSKWLTGGCVLALIATGCGSKGERAPAAGGDALVLGASLSLTGSLAREGLLTKEGYDLCQASVNAKGGVPVGDKKYRLDIRYQDDTSKPDTAGTLVDQFNDQGIKLILGPYGSATTEAAAAVIERNGQVMADSAGADDKIFEKGYTRTFAVLSPATKYAASIVKAIAELASPKPKRIAFLSADDGFSKTVTVGGAAEAKAQGIDVVATEYFPSGAADVSASLTKVKAKQPDVIIGSVHLVEGVAIVKQAKELGITPSGGFGETVAPPTPDFVKTLGPIAENVLGSTQWTPQTTGRDDWFGSAADYVTAFQAKFNRIPEYHNAEATAACLTLVLGAQKSNSTDPNKIRDAIAALNAASFFGPITFDPTGKNVAKPMSVIQIQHGKPVAVWPKSDAEAPLVWPGVSA